MQSDFSLQRENVTCNVVSQGYHAGAFFRVYAPAKHACAGPATFARIQYRFELRFDIEESKK